MTDDGSAARTHPSPQRGHGAAERNAAERSAAERDAAAPGAAAAEPVDVRQPDRGDHRKVSITVPSRRSGCMMHAGG